MVFKGDMPDVKSSDVKLGKDRDEKMPKDDILDVKPGEKKAETGTKLGPASKPFVVKKDSVVNIKPEEKKVETAVKPVSTSEPIVIKPDGKERPAIPELKGEPGKKLERKKPEKAPREPVSRPLTLALFISMVLLAAGTTLLVLSILDIPVPDGAKPVMDFCRKLPLFPE